MTRLGVFTWTMFACFACMLSISLVAAAIFMSSAFGALLQNAWFLAFFLGFFVLYLGGGVGLILGLASMLQKKASRDSWGRQARSIAVWGNPAGIVFGSIRFLARLPGRPAA